MQIKQAIQLTAADLAKLKRAQKAAGLSAAALGEQLGVSRAMVSQVLLGSKPASAELLRDLCGLLGLDFSAKLVVHITPKKS